MRNRCLKLAVVFLAFLPGRMTAQDDANGVLSMTAELRKNNYSPSAQTWEFVRYGNTPVEFYTGTARADIPVYTYADADFTIPVSLGYASCGFMPGQQTGIVGLNWFLNAGGVITREIRGLDDLTGVASQGTHGFLCSGAGPFIDSVLLTDNTKLIDEVPRAGRSETQSDIYHFNFPGHSGTFHFDGQKVCRVYDRDGGLGCCDVSFRTAGYLSEFTLVTADGYRYVFGSVGREDDELYVERVLNGGYKAHDILFYYERKDGNPGPVVSWMLRKATAPNGRSVEFVYENGAVRMEKYMNPDLDYLNYIVTFAQDMYHVAGEGMPEQLYKRPHILKTTYLREINIDGKVRIGFDYSKKDTPEAVRQAGQAGIRYSPIVRPLLKLDKISVSADGMSQPLRTCLLSYQMLDLRPLLTGVRVSGMGNYAMEYYTAPADSGKPTFPDLLTEGVDFWGYANGRTDVSEAAALAGTQTDALWNEYARPGSCKNPNASYSVYGCLKKLIYPTGGWTEFEYEGHTAEYAVLKRYAEGNTEPDTELAADLDAELRLQRNLPELKGPFMSSLHKFSVLQIPDNQVGGIRICKITDDDGEGGRTTRTFTYTDAAGNSSGNLLHFPRYLACTDERGASVYMMCITSVRTTFDKSHVEYARVQERRPDDSKIVYLYTNYRTNPDDYSGQTRIVHLDAEGSKYRPMLDSLFECNILRNPNSRKSRRGKLSAVLSYDAADQLVRREDYRYEDHLEGCGLDYSAYVVTSGRYNWSTKLYAGNYRLAQKRTTDYFPSGSRSTVTSYGYNRQEQPNLTVTADGVDTLSERIRYIPDIAPLVRSEAERRMFGLHIFAPVEKVLTRREEGSEKMTAAVCCEYGLFDTMPQICRMGTALIGSPQPLSDTPVFSIDVSIDAYDTLGNVCQTTDKSGLVTTYIWGYGGLYLLAKIEHATRDEIRALGVSAVGEAPAEGALSAAEEAVLRSLAGALVTTYDYVPYVGVSRITDPAGQTFFYEYDADGKLTVERDTHGNIVRRYNYSVVNGGRTLILKE